MYFVVAELNWLLHSSSSLTPILLKFTKDNKVRKQVVIILVTPGTAVLWLKKTALVLLVLELRSEIVLGTPYFYLMCCYLRLSEGFSE